MLAPSGSRVNRSSDTNVDAVDEPFAVVAFGAAALTDGVRTGENDECERTPGQTSLGVFLLIQGKRGVTRKLKKSLRRIVEERANDASSAGERNEHADRQGTVGVARADFGSALNRIATFLLHQPTSLRQTES
jgi:hypothetical protein